MDSGFQSPNYYAPRVSMRKIQNSLVMGGCFILLVGGWAIWKYGSIGAAVAAYRGYPIFIESPRLRVGEVEAGGVFLAEIPVKNISGEKVTAIGSDVDCSCVEVKNLPLEIPPGESRSISIRVQIGKKRSKKSHIMQLHLDKPSPPVIVKLLLEKSG